MNFNKTLQNADATELYEALKERIGMKDQVLCPVGFWRLRASGGPGGDDGVDMGVFFGHILDIVATNVTPNGGKLYVSPAKFLSEGTTELHDATFTLEDLNFRQTADALQAWMAYWPPDRDEFKIKRFTRFSKECSEVVVHFGPETAPDKLIVLNIHVNQEKFVSSIKTNRGEFWFSFRGSRPSDKGKITDARNEILRDSILEREIHVAMREAGYVQNHARFGNLYFNETEMKERDEMLTRRKDLAELQRLKEKYPNR